MEDFTIGGKTFKLYKSAYSMYERQIEVPYALSYIEGVSPSDILEIGNCLYNVGVTGHTVVDKYESASGVLNVDIVDYKSDPLNKFLIIISISTLEHIGKDEGLTGLLTQSKIIKAISNIRNNLLKSLHGKFLFTIPVGYNPSLDCLLFSGEIKLTTVHFMKQVTLGEWKEITVFEAKTAQYNYPFPAGNVILFGEIKNG